MLKLVKIIHLNNFPICNFIRGISVFCTGHRHFGYLHEIHTACASRWSDPDKAEVGCGQMTHMRGHHATHKLVTKLVVRHDPWEIEWERNCYKNNKTKQSFSYFGITIFSGHFSFMFRFITLFGFSISYAVFYFLLLEDN